MTSIATGYDLLASQFSPDGRIFQIEYAQKAVQKSGTVIALKGKDCVVFAVEKLLKSKLYEADSNKRIFTIDQHIGIAVAGYIPDGRHIIETGRNEASCYKLGYNQKIPLKYLNSRIAMYVHAYTLYGATRPFGASVIMASYEHNEPLLSCIDVSGVCYNYFGCAVGKGKEASKTEIESLSLADLTCKQLVREAARIIYTVHDEAKDKNFELELSWVGKNTYGKHKFVPKKLFQDAERYAKAAIAENNSSDEI